MSSVDRPVYMTQEPTGFETQSPLPKIPLNIYMFFFPVTKEKVSKSHHKLGNLINLMQWTKNVSNTPLNYLEASYTESRDITVTKPQYACDNLDPCLYKPVLGTFPFILRL